MHQEAAAQDSAPPAAEEPEGRILGVIPNNKTVPQSALKEEPLTTRKKFGLAFKDTTDPFTIVLASFYAGVAQWQNDFPTFGQGGTGFAKRFGAAYADQAIGNYLTEAILPSLLREDPRYFRKGSGSARHRIDYALSRTFITRTDRGRNRFNYSEIVGGTALRRGSRTCIIRPRSGPLARQWKNSASRWLVTAPSTFCWNSGRT